jgi:hypothetical protein
MAAAPLRPPASLDALLAGRRVWRGQPAALPPARQPTGLAALDGILPTHGWPDAALSELLLPADGVGELRLLLPTLARLTAAGRDIVLVAPPWLPYPTGWEQAGVDFGHVHLVDANPRDALWAAEQCLRGGCLAAVLCWPTQADDRALRRLQVACETGQALGFALRDARAAANPSPAALRLLFEREDTGMQLRVLKCRGGNAPARAIALEQVATPDPMPATPGQVEPVCAPGMARTRPDAASGNDRPAFPHAAPAQARPGGAPPARATPPVVRARLQAASVERARPPGVLPFLPVPSMSAPPGPASLPAIA